MQASQGEPTSGSSKSSKSGEKAPYEEKDNAYFGYYANLTHQMQMLQDAARTSVYQRAIQANARACIEGKRVMDVGAGNGILSMFAAQAGAQRVYAVEASGMARHLQHLLDAAKQQTGESGAAVSNPWAADRIRVVHSKMEDVTPEMIRHDPPTTAGDAADDGKVDTIVSECLGVLLLHERMCESFVDARDRFLKPGGTMLPSAGTICLAPIEDRDTWQTTCNKARWWETQNFYGVDLRPFARAAWEEAFGSPLVGFFDSSLLLTPSSDHHVDFVTITQEEMRVFDMELDFGFTQAAVVHGLGGWFDLHFTATGTTPPPLLGASSGVGADDTTMDEAGSTARLASSAYGGLHAEADPFQPLLKEDLAGALNGFTEATSSSYLSTSPYATPTHWQQIRFFLPEPIGVNKGQSLRGTMHFSANEQRSYDLSLDLRLEDEAGRTVLERKAAFKLDRQVY